LVSRARPSASGGAHPGDRDRRRSSIRHALNHDSTGSGAILRGHDRARGRGHERGQRRALRCRKRAHVGGSRRGPFPAMYRKGASVAWRVFTALRTSVAASDREASG
jgi:hypothetical protein